MLWGGRLSFIPACSVALLLRPGADRILDLSHLLADQVQLPGQGLPSLL
jgi:hypothetical protein